MNNTILKLDKRSEIGGGRARRLIERGLIPAVVYGKNTPSTAAMVNASELRRFLRVNGKNAFFNAEFAEEHELSMLIKNIQYDPVSKEIIHLDLQKVNPDEKIQVQIPVKVTGEENVRKAGNTVIHQLNSVEVECLPVEIPPYIVADITGFNPGRSITAGSLALPSGISMLSNPDQIIVTVKGQKGQD